MPLSAIFFPIDPEADAFDLVQQANDGIRAGLRLCTNGRQMALMQKPAKGWALFAARIVTHANTPPCAA